MSNNLKISIIIPTLNNSEILPQFLKRLRNQDYPKRSTEIICSDGGSTDNTIDIMKKHGAKILKNPGVYADIGVSIGMKVASGDLLIILAVDNFLNDRNSLKEIAKTFLDNEISAAFPIHASSKSDTFITKYINKFTDPFNHFVYGYAANGRTFKKIYKTLKSTESYDIYDFNSSDDKPLIAFAQGFTFRKGYLKRKKDEFDDLMPVIDLLGKNKKIAFVHSVKLYHHTVRNIVHFINKQKWATNNYLEKKQYGLHSREGKLSISQRIRVRIWPYYVATILLPILFALYHLIKDREIEWIYHPILCYISFYASIVSTISYLNRRINQ